MSTPFADAIESDLPTCRVVGGSNRNSSRVAEEQEPPPTANVAVQTPPPVRVPFPEPGQSFAGFELLGTLGRGAFGRVFLARQTALADRTVVLKVGPHLSDETHTLAQLQHPNVVPVYSFHRDGPLHAVCMPYLGPVTLAHVVARLRTADVSTLNGRALSTLITAVRKDKQPALPPTGEPEPLAEPAVRPAGRRVTLDGLGGLGYVDAVVWIGRQLAAGLTAAHARQIVHSDLKPANVLLSDDGRPMLLDFGVAVDRKARADAVKVGGTCAYMAPEHLRAFRGGDDRPDERSDLYSLGLILFELLAGGLPFDPFEQTAEAVETWPPPVVAANRRVPPAVEAIVHKCLAADPAARYQSAAELEDDLGRQLARRPLRFAPNRSAAELAGKWATRHRRLLAVAGAVLVGGATAAGFAVHDARSAEKLAGFEATARADRFEAAARRVRSALVLNSNVSEQAAALTDAETLLAAGMISDRLPPDRRSDLRTQSAGLLLDMSRAAGVRATVAREPAERAGWLAKATDWNRQAAAAFPDASPPRGVWTQRAWLERLAGDPAAAGSAASAAATPLRTAADHRTEGLELMDQGQWRAGAEHLGRAAGLDPRDFWAAFALGQCNYRMGYDVRAVAAYDLCAALDATVPGVYFNRGLALLRNRQFEKAAADFGRVIDARADWPDPYLNRASAREGAGDLAGAVEDLTKALELGHPPTAVRLARGRVLTKLGKAAEAKADIAAGLAAEPADEKGWVARGSAKMPAKPGPAAGFAAALADFDRALDLNPKSLVALQYKARVYSMSGQTRPGVAVLSELLRFYPEAVDALSGRAVLHARLGDRAAAHADAAEAVRVGGEHPRTAYQLAGVYATTARTHPADKREALRLLASALRGGFGYEHLATDKELDPIRQDAEFEATVADARRAFDQRTKSAAGPVSAAK